MTGGWKKLCHSELSASELLCPLKQCDRDKLLYYTSVQDYRADKEPIAPIRLSHVSCYYDNTLALRGAIIYHEMSYCC